MSKSFDEFRKKAQGILPENADIETISSVAFHLSQLENEKNLEVEVLKMKMKTEMEQKLQKLESDNKQRQSTAFHSKQLSAVVQRQVVESFLKTVLDAYKSGTGPIFDVKSRLSKATVKDLNTAAAAQFPSMSAIDRAVRIPAMQTAVWEHFNFVQHVEYPVLSNDLLYGTLSAGVHIKVFKHILVSDMADDSYKEFFNALGNYFRQSVVEYSEVDASTYEDEQEGKQASGDGDG